MAGKSDMMQMSPVDAVVVKAQGSVTFAEKGYHLMLMQPKRAVQPGDRVPVTLILKSGRKITVPFEVRG